MPYVDHSQDLDISIHNSTISDQFNDNAMDEEDILPELALLSSQSPPASPIIPLPSTPVRILSIAEILTLASPSPTSVIRTVPSSPSFDSWSPTAPSLHIQNSLPASPLSSPPFPHWLVSSLISHNDLLGSDSPPESPTSLRTSENDVFMQQSLSHFRSARNQMLEEMKTLRSFGDPAIEQTIVAELQLLITTPIKSSPIPEFPAAATAGRATRLPQAKPRTGLVRPPRGIRIKCQQTENIDLPPLPRGKKEKRKESHAI